MWESDQSIRERTSRIEPLVRRSEARRQLDIVSIISSTRRSDVGSVIVRLSNSPSSATPTRPKPTTGTESTRCECCRTSGSKITSSSLRHRDLRELRIPAITKVCLCSSVSSSTAGSQSEWAAAVQLVCAFASPCDAPGAARERVCREPRPRRSRGEGLWVEEKTGSCGGFSSCSQ